MSLSGMSVRVYARDYASNLAEDTLIANRQ